MARIPEVDLDRLKREVSLERLVQAQGIELKKHGVADLIGRCPFHDDKSPSLVISPKKNLWHCLGACQQGGSVIDWVMKRDAVSFRHAVEVLRGDVLPSPAASIPVPVDEAKQDHEIVGQVVAYYHETLKQSPEALQYLEQRGLKSQEAIERFKLGFANRTLTYRLPPNGSKAGLDARARLQRLGVLRESGHEHLNGSLVVPIVDEHGDVLGMYGRKITPNLRPGTPQHLYLPGPHRGVFNHEALQADKTVILCEALIDALTFWCAGFRNVTASYGVQGFTADHLEAFRKHGTERVLIAYDRDEAGEHAAEALAVQLQAAGLECFRIQFPKGMDANEYACNVTPAEKSLGVLVRNAVWLGKGKRSGLPSLPSSGPEGSTPVVSQMIEQVEDELLPALAILPVEAGSTAKVSAAPTVLDHDLVAVERAPAEAKSSVPAAIATPTTPAAGPVDRPAQPTPAVELPKPLPSLAAKEEPSRTPAAEATGDELRFECGERHYRVRGLAKQLSHDALRVNLLATRGERVFVDTLDLHSARQRGAFVKQAAAELESHEDTIKRDVGQILLKLEAAQDELIQRALEPKHAEVKLSDEEQARAMELLRDPHLLDRILRDFAACGVVGEEASKLLGYLAAVSRKLDEPLAVIIQSSSAAGKTALMEAILAFMPEEERVKYSAMTGQSLFYMGATNLKHKILAIVEEQGAERASYALKLLQSEGELTIASTGKDPQTGKLVTHEYRVEGPVMIFMTTTAVEIDEELLNRCLVLSVDEDREQTRAIHRLQREKQTLEGLLARRIRPALVKLHQDAQRMLKPILVANPYARELTFLDDRTRTRRDHVKYLTLIRTIALLHQYQRPIKSVEHGGVVVPYVEVTKDDIAVANKLAHQTLGRSLDELAPQTRRLLEALDGLVGEACQAQQVERTEFRFTRKDVRAFTGLSQTQLRIHLDRLVDLEYVTAHHGHQGQGYVYELLYDGQGQDGKPFVTGLIDVEALGKPSTTVTSRGVDPNFTGVWRGENGPISGGWRGGGGATSSTPARSESTFEPKQPENAHLEHDQKSSRSPIPGNGRAGSALPPKPSGH
jgi:DNA primase